MEQQPILSVKDVVKRFGGLTAVNHVSLDIYPGEVVGLVGDNGAGKSTLIKVLSGFHRPDSGELEIGGRRIDWSRYDVRGAREIGVETVYQERSLGERQPLWRNVFVGRHITNAFGLIDVKREKTETMKLLTGVVGLRGAGIHPDARVATLSGGERQGLAIARAMYFDASIIILDEPTTALAVGEVEKVLSFVERIRDEGRSCIFISHELPHVYRIADRFALMERGKIAAVLDRSSITLDGLAQRLLLAGNG